jgi:transcriptional antiterminator RfaH
MRPGRNANLRFHASKEGSAMNFTNLSNEPHWYAIHTHPKQEERANINLRAWGVKTLSPLIRQPRSRRFQEKPSYQVQPMFPQYIFAHFVASSSLSKVWFTRGVHNVVHFGDSITPVDDGAIALIESQLGSDSIVRLGELKCGDKVRINQGPFQSLTGIFEKNIKGTERVMLLLEAINYQGRILIDRELVGKVA